MTSVAQTRRTTTDTTVDSVPLANARIDLQTLEATNEVIERRRREQDVFYNIFTARDGLKLTSLFERVVAKYLYARLARHRALISEGNITLPERTVPESRLVYIEEFITKLCEAPANDDMARCIKQALVLFAMIREPAFRERFIRSPPPQHPFPHSNEAMAETARAIAQPKQFANTKTLVAFLTEYLYDEYVKVTTPEPTRFNVQNWVTDAAMAYISRLPLDSGIGQ